LIRIIIAINKSTVSAGWTL